MEFNVVKGVQCETCGKLHDLDGDTFIAFHGNVTVGAKSGIYGSKNNDKVSVFCRSSECLNVLFSKIDDIANGVKLVENVEKHDKQEKVVNTTDNIKQDGQKVITEDIPTEKKEESEKIVKNEDNSKKEDKKSGELAFDPTMFE